MYCNKLIVIVSILLIFTLGCAQDNSKSDFNPVTTKLAVLPEDSANLTYYTISADGRYAAFRMQDGNKFVIVSDNKKGMTYDDVSTPGFSYNGKHLGYIARNNASFFIVLDGIEGKYYDGVGYTIFSDNSEHLAYLAYTAGNYYIVIGDKEYGPYYELAMVQPYISSDGKLVAYTDKEQKTIFVNGKENGKYYFIYGIAFSSDNKTLGYIAEKAGDNFVVINGRERKHYPYPVNSLKFSPDGKSYAYSVQGYDEFGRSIGFIVVNETEGKNYGQVAFPIFSPDSYMVSYIVYKDDKSFLVTNGEEGQPYDLISSPVFSRKGHAFAYPYVKGRTWSVVFNGNELPQSYDYDPEKDYFSFFSWAAISNDEKHLAYPVRIGEKYSIIVDDKQGKLYDKVSVPIFSEDSKHVAYIAEKGTKKYIILDEKESKPYDDIKLGRYNLESTKIGVAVRIGNEIWWIVEDVK